MMLPFLNIFLKSIREETDFHCMIEFIEAFLYHWWQSLADILLLFKSMCVFPDLLISIKSHFVRALSTSNHPNYPNESL